MQVHSPGTRLGQFEVISYPVLSDVSIDYICLDHETSCPALLKTLRPELLKNRAARDHFAQSGAAWIDLGAHPHIVRCYDLFRLGDTDKAYLVLQAVVPEKDRDTNSLVSWLVPGRPLPVLQALLFGLQIARGMRHVTEKKPDFVHGDLKPENVLVSGGRLSQAAVNRLRVTDFGLAALLKTESVQMPEGLNASQASVERTQLINGVVGTPLYMAPEQWRAETARTAADVYALGCLFYRMVVGRHPVAGTTVDALRNAHTTGNMRPLPASLPVVVHELVTRCLALEPEERYQNWDAVESAVSVAYKEMVGWPIPASEPTDAPTESERALTGWFFNGVGSASREFGGTNTAMACYEQAVSVGHAEGDQALVGTATSGLGEVYRMLGDSTRAIGHHERALAIAREIGDRTVEGLATHNMGIVHLQTSNPRRAIECFEQALEIAHEIGDRQGEMASLTSMGNVHQHLGELRRSIQYFERVLEIARKAGKRREESGALVSLGGAHLDLGDNRRAIEYLEQALAIKNEIGERYGQMACLNNLGSAYRNTGRAPRASECHERALGIAREMGDRRGEAFALNNIGSTHSSLGNMQLALEHHEQALEIFREIGDKRSEGLCLTNLAFIHMTRQDTQRAMETCEQALAIDREIGDMMGMATDSYNIANLLVQQGRFSDALPYAEESAGLLVKLGHTEKAPEVRQLVEAIRAKLDPRASKEDASVTTFPPSIEQQILRMRQDNPSLTANMSDEDIVTLLQQADYASTKERDGATSATTFVKHPGQPWKERERTDGPGSGHSVDEPVARGDSAFEFPPEVKERIQQFRTDNPGPAANMSDAEIAAHLIQSELARMIDNVDNMSASDCGAYGDELLTSGLTQEAERFYRAQLEKSTHEAQLDQQASALTSLGQISVKRGHISQAVTHYREGLELAERINHERLAGSIYNAMGEIHRLQGRHADAIESYNKSLELYQKIDHEQGLAAVYGNLGIVAKNQGDFEAAIRFYEKSLEYSTTLGDDRLTANQYTNLGVVYFLQGRYDLAEKMHKKCLEISQRLGIPDSAASAYGNLGTIYHMIGEYQKAIEMHHNALAIMQGIGNEHGVSMVLCNLAGLCLLKGDVQQALAHYEQAQTGMEAIGNLSGLAGVHFSRGLLFKQQGRTAEARKELTKAQGIFGRLGENQWLQRVEKELQLL
jgi:tetratricopeptide (TPR) repeat protein